MLPLTTAEADGVLSTIVGWFNNVVLYPVKTANITYRYKLESFEDDLKNKVVRIPEGYGHNPQLMIAGPTLEALKYAFDEAELREMYLNLLTSSMDLRKDNVVHPLFVDIIKQLSPPEAIFLKYLKGHRKALIDYECNAVFGNNLIQVPKEFKEQNLLWSRFTKCMPRAIKERKDNKCRK